MNHISKKSSNLEQKMIGYDVRLFDDNLILKGDNFFSRLDIPIKTSQLFIENKSFFCIDTILDNDDQEEIKHFQKINNLHFENSELRGIYLNIVGNEIFFELSFHIGDHYDGSDYNENFFIKYQKANFEIKK